MHAEAREFVAQAVAGHTFARVLEFGSRNINGGVRDLFDCTEYVGLDIAPGPDVDVVGDAADWERSGFDAVVCCEVLEHTPDGKAIIAAARRALVDGLLIVTCATDPREPHSATDGGTLRPGEYYANVSPTDLAGWLGAAGFVTAEITTRPWGDLYCTAVA